MKAIPRDFTKTPHYPSNPAAGIIKDTLEAHEISQAQAAREMKIPRSRLTDIFAGRKGVSADTALRCERYLGISARILIELQARYDFSIASQQKSHVIDKEITPLQLAAQPA